MKKIISWRIVYVLVVLLVSAGLFVSGCSVLSVSEQIENDEGEIEVIFCGSDCAPLVAEMIKEGEVDCAFYALEGKVGRTLAENNGARLVLEGRNKDGLTEGVRIDWIEGKIEYKLSGERRSGLMHNKFCVEGERVVTGSSNLKGEEKKFDHMLFIKSRLLAENYEDEFEEMWRGKFRGGKKVRHPKVNLSGMLVKNYFCPEDDCQERVLEELSLAEEEILFMTYRLTDYGIGKKLIEKFKKGIRVRGMIEKQGSSKYEQKKRLEKAGIEVKWEKTSKMLHHKVFIIDREIVVAGSYNPTKSGNERNDENIVIISDEKIAKEFLEEFERVWGGSQI